MKLTVPNKIFIHEYTKKFYRSLISIADVGEGNKLIQLYFHFGIKNYIYLLFN